MQIRPQRTTWKIALSRDMTDLAESRAERRILQACFAAGLHCKDLAQEADDPRGGEWVLLLDTGEILRARSAREMATVVIPDKVSDR